MKHLMTILNDRGVLNVGWIRACSKDEHPLHEENYVITPDMHGCFNGPKKWKDFSHAKVPKTFQPTFNFSDFIETSYNATWESLLLKLEARF
ncbi:Protein BREAST CANCER SUSCEPTIBILITY 1 like [Dendrobium catenatum]|uniref:Protein BREAST CANCER SUSCEPTIBILITY 1 like n=1 Tax=Dendrobium catenatum TaxID=906689 RepID=A0A2I0XDK7_9ASPA|nr:Protein BREAST CANCER SUSCEPTIBILITY 1 like [Dendrobium catenatum]